MLLPDHALTHIRTSGVGVPWADFRGRDPNNSRISYFMLQVDGWVYVIDRIDCWL